MHNSEGFKEGTKLLIHNKSYQLSSNILMLDVKCK